MYAGEIIHHQIEANGTIKTIRVPADESPYITIAFPHEYSESRTTPLHFFDEQDEVRFKAALASSRVMRLSPKQFQQTENVVTYHNSIRGIHGGRGTPALLTISLPEEAALEDLVLFDPCTRVGQIDRSLHKDSTTRRFTIYIDTFALKNLEIEMRFVIDPKQFDGCNYSDQYTQIDDYPSTQILDGAVTREVRILLQNPVLGDQYFVGQAGAVGPNAIAIGTTLLNDDDG
jgi:hypothetical protein